jgi:hypothetical protein
VDPPADCPGRDPDNVRHVRNGEESHRWVRLAWGDWSSWWTVVSAPAEGARS